jgi:hypothetical protein
VPGAGAAERADRLVAVGPELEAEVYVICHVSQLHAARPTLASGEGA